MRYGSRTRYFPQINLSLFLSCFAGRIVPLPLRLLPSPSICIATRGSQGKRGGSTAGNFLPIAARCCAPLEAFPVCVCLLLQYLIQSCARGGRRIVEDMCYEIRRAEDCVD
jgi:hypothetical protein